MDIHDAKNRIVREKARGNLGFFALVIVLLIAVSLLSSWRFVLLLLPFPLGAAIGHLAVLAFGHSAYGWTSHFLMLAGYSVTSWVLLGIGDLGQLTFWLMAIQAGIATLLAIHWVARTRIR